MPENTPVRSPDRTTRFTYGAVIGALMVAEAMAAFESGMIYLALPSLMSAFDTSVASVGWVITAYYLVAAISAGVCGRIGDQFGRKKLILWLTAVATAGSFVSLLGDSLLIVVIGRGLQGASGAILPLAVALARSAAPSPSRAPMGISAVSASAVAGGSVGVVVAGVMIQASSWHSIFIFSGILGLVAFVAVSIVVPGDSARASEPGTRMDWVGALLLAPAIALVLLAVTKGRDWGWLSGGILILGAAGVALLVIWIWWELRVADPLIQLRDFIKRHLAITLVATAAACGLFNLPSLVNSIVLQGPTDLDLGLGVSASAVGLLSCVSGLAAFALLPLIGRIATRRGGGQVLTLAAVTTFAVILTYLLGHSSVAAMVVAVFLAAVASMFVTSALPILVTESVPESRTAATVGATAVVRAVATSAIAAVGAAVFASSTSLGTNQPDVTGLVRILALLGLFATVSLGAGLLLRFDRVRREAVTNEVSDDAPDAIASST